MAARMSVYVDTSDEWFIRYGNDMEVMSAYHEETRRHGTHFLKAADLNPLHESEVIDLAKKYRVFTMQAC